MPARGPRVCLMTPRVFVNGITMGRSDWSQGRSPHLSLVRRPLFISGGNVDHVDPILAGVSPGY